MSDAPLVRIRDVHKYYSRGSERIDVGLDGGIAG